MANGTEYYRGIRGLRPILPELPAGISDWKPDEYAALERLRKAGVQNPEKLAQWETYAPMEKAARAYVPRVAGAVPDEQQLKRQVVQSLGRGRVTPAMLESLGRMQQATNALQRQRLEQFQGEGGTVDKAQMQAFQQRARFLEKGGGSVAERKQYQALKAQAQAEARRAARGAEDFRVWQERKKFLTDEDIRKEEAKTKAQSAGKKTEIEAQRDADIAKKKEELQLEFQKIDKQFGNDKAKAEFEQGLALDKIWFESSLKDQEKIREAALPLGFIQIDDPVTNTKRFVRNPDAKKLISQIDQVLPPLQRPQMESGTQPQMTVPQQQATVPPPAEEEATAYTPAQTAQARRALMDPKVVRQLTQNPDDLWKVLRAAGFR